MKILVLSHLYPSPEQQISGIFVHEQVKALRNREIDARVVTWQEGWVSPRQPFQAIKSYKQYLNHANGILEWKEEDQVPFIRFPCLFFARCGEWMKSLLYSRSFQRILDKVKMDFPFDVIHAHTTLMDGAAAVDAKQHYNVPVIITEHTGPLEAHLKTNGMRRRVAHGFKYADHVITVSDFLRKEVEKQFPRLKMPQLSVIGNGVATDLFSPMHRKKNTVPKILWVGQFYENKQPLMAIEAIKHAMDTGISFFVEMAGTGPLEKQVRDLIEQLHLSNHMRLLGYVSRQELAKHMATADFLMISSKVETFCLVAAESLCCGTPVLSTRCGGPEEIISNHEFGRLISENNFSCLAQGIVSMISNLSLFDRDAISRKAREKYKMGNLAEKLEFIYRSVQK